MLLHEWIQNPAVFCLVLAAISVLAGLIGSILGLGGGIVIVPTLTLLFGINIRYAIGASLIATIATSSGAAAAYVRDRVTNVRVAIFLEVGTAIGALTGAALSGLFSDRTLYAIFAAMMVYAIINLALKTRKSANARTVATRPDPIAEALHFASSYPDRVSGQEIQYRVEKSIWALAVMLLAGMISALLGLGSGVLKVPAMDGLMKLPLHVSSATSNFMIGVTAAASAGAYFMHGNIVPIVAAPVALGVLAGSVIGARIMVRMKTTTLRWAFIAVLTVVFVEMAQRGWS